TNGTCPMTIVRKWVGTDTCANATTNTQTITVNDTMPPVLVGCPTNESLQCVNPPAPAAVTATDNCDSNPVVTYSATTNGINPMIITRTWTARDFCTNSASCTQTITIQPCAPLVCVTKEIACFLGTNAQGVEVCGTFGKLATGIQGDTQDPAFCYRITVSNCGPVALTNVTVIDDRYGDLTTNFVPSLSASLAIGGSATYTFKVDLGGASLPGHIALVTNTVVVDARSAVSGVHNSAQDQAVAQIIPAGVAAQQLFTIDNGALTDCVRLDASDSTPHIVVTYVKIINAGLADLLNVTIVGNGTNPCGINTILDNLAAGAMVTIPVCTNESYVCNDLDPTSVSVTASAFAYTNVEQVCAHDMDGKDIIVRAEAPGCVQCFRPNACRVTGGGRQNGPLLTYPDDVRYVTHGGQVGAPVSTAVCEVTTNFARGNPCIHGRWTHVRHASGGLQGNFHARFFDTLECACLGTNVSPGGVYDSGTVVDGICNPGDRISGPEPRHAPANKIAFTGVGDWADPNGRRASRATLFRVDIEDRSEPGGGHAGGQTPPPDRYRIRIWVLTANELAQLNGAGPDRYLLGFRTAISACNGINVRDGVDVPNGTAVFGQRPPDIDDGGELERGNHQIHPMVQHCDFLNPGEPGLANP
ncbi:MAG TPA: hypothetical protein VI454_05670, partial [Verrucomicrobiae bacterium]